LARLRTAIFKQGADRKNDNENIAIAKLLKAPFLHKFQIYKLYKPPSIKPIMLADRESCESPPEAFGILAVILAKVRDGQQPLGSD